MKCSDFEQAILLSSSGELQEADTMKLEEHVGDCESCRAYRADLGSTSSAFASVHVPEPSPGIVEGIIKAGEISRGRGRLVMFPFPVRRALASAACLMIIAGGVFMMQDSEQDDGMNELSSIISLVSEDQSDLECEDALCLLAEQLLTLQGFNDPDEFIELEYPDEEPLPTALQLRNTREPLLRRCV
jgi:hypothetical protein